VESRHGGDSVVGSDLGKDIDINLVESDGLVRLGELLEDRGDSFAGTAPGGKPVDDNGGLDVLDLGVKFLGTGIVSVVQSYKR
jgi:hypothetical protein